MSMQRLKYEKKSANSRQAERSRKNLARRTLRNLSKNMRHDPERKVYVLTAYLANKQRIMDRNRHYSKPSRLQKSNKRSNRNVPMHIGQTIDRENEITHRTMHPTQRPNRHSHDSEVEILPDQVLTSMSRDFHNAREEVFEDGMDSHFGARLNRTVETHGVAAIRALKKIITRDDVNVEAAEEALRQIGHMDDEKTYHQRLSLLEYALKSSNVRIRDAASIGIEAMDDPAAMESLQNAIGKESCAWLRQNLQDVLTHLQEKYETVSKGHQAG